MYKKAKCTRGTTLTRRTDNLESGLTTIQKFQARRKKPERKTRICSSFLLLLPIRLPSLSLGRCFPLTIARSELHGKETHARSAKSEARFIDPHNQRCKIKTLIGLDNGSETLGSNSDFSRTSSDSNCEAMHSSVPYQQQIRNTSLILQFGT